MLFSIFIAFVSFGESENIPSKMDYNDRTSDNDVEGCFCDSFMAYYFTRLLDNFPEQNNSSSSFVVASMLLSYYDTYLDDRFVPEKYDLNAIVENNSVDVTMLSAVSPGVMNDAMICYGKISNIGRINLYELIGNYEEAFFNQYLISLGYSFGIFDENGTQDLLPYALTPDELTTLLEGYLSLVGLDTVNVVMTIEPTQDFVISKIRENTPVILCKYTSERFGPNNNGVAMLAYDYSVYNDEIYIHSNFRRGNGLTTYKYQHLGENFDDTDDTYIYAAIYLDTSALTHSCSDNYFYRPTNNPADDIYYCSCDLTVPAHIHRAEVEGESISYTVDSSKHIYTCHCGVIEEAHEYQYLADSFEKHKATCVKCGYTMYESHRFRINSQTDTGTCLDCGLTKILDDDMIQLGVIPGDVAINTNVNVAGQSGRYITANGSIMLFDGTVIFSEIDAELYLNGLLDLDSICGGTEDEYESY